MSNGTVEEILIVFMFGMSLIVSLILTPDNTQEIPEEFPVCMSR